jgi:hypothetical protein
MATEWLDMPVTAISEDDRYPDSDTRHIYEHLLFQCSLPREFPLPAIKARVLDGKVVVTSGHKFLRIAKDLKHQTIRVILDRGDAVSFSLPVGAKPIAREDLQRETEVAVVRQHQAFFFEEPLSLEEQKEFEVEIGGFFDRLRTPLIDANQRRLLSVSFPFEGSCAVLEALVPVGDHSWPESYRKTCQRFSGGVKKIVSFVGARFA